MTDHHDPGPSSFEEDAPEAADNVIEFDSAILRSRFPIPQRLTPSAPERSTLSSGPDSQEDFSPGSEEVLWWSEEREKAKARQYLTWVFLGLYVLVIGIGAFTWMLLPSRNLAEYGSIIIAPCTGLLGTIVGYHFGKRQ